jgi:hypothetical protein
MSLLISLESKNKISRIVSIGVDLIRLVVSIKKSEWKETVESADIENGISFCFYTFHNYEQNGEWPLCQNLLCQKPYIVKMIETIGNDTLLKVSIKLITMSKMPFNHFVKSLSRNETFDEVILPMDFKLITL